MTIWGYETRQSEREEWMDQPGVTEVQLHQVYRELRFINRWLGGHQISLEGIRRTVPKGPVSVLDVGFGGGDFAEVLVDWSKRTGRSFRYVGIESSPFAVQYARDHVGHPDVLFQVQDLFSARPEDLGSFDVVHMSLTLHHFPGESAVRAMRTMSQFAHGAVVVNDLHRSFVPYALIKGLTALFSKSPLVQTDAPLSVNRAYRREDLQDICRRAGLAAEVYWRPMFRWLLLARSDSVPD